MSLPRPEATAADPVASAALAVLGLVAMPADRRQLDLQVSPLTGAGWTWEMSAAWRHLWQLLPPKGSPLEQGSEGVADGHSGKPLRAAAPEGSRSHNGENSRSTGEGSGVTAQSAAALVQPVGAKAHPGGRLPGARAAIHAALIGHRSCGRQGAQVVMTVKELRQELNPTEHVD